MGNLDRQKVLMIFGAALLCAFLMSWFVYRNTVAPRTEKMVKVAAASRDMAAGTRLKDADVKLVSVPEKDAPKSAFNDVKLVQERVLLFPVNANEPISANRLSALTGGEGLASTIEPGKRAVSVPFTDSSGAGGLVQPRSHVDVLFTRTGSMNEAVTTVVLENVVVLAIGRNTEVGSVSAAGAPGASPTPSSSASRAATLLVTPEQAAKLEFARQQGKISLALRNPLDDSVSTGEDTPVITATDVKVGLGPRRLANGRIAGRVPNLRDDQVWDNITAAPRAAPKPKPEPPKEPPKPKFVVDVYRGDKHVQEIFQ